MAIDETVEAQILRYHFVEKWGPHTIAKQLGVHHYTVSRVIHRSIGPPAMRLAKPSILYLSANEPKSHVLFSKLLHALMLSHQRECLDRRRLDPEPTQRACKSGLN